MFKKLFLKWLLMSAAIASISIADQEVSLSSADIAHVFGTPKESHYLPKAAVDTDDVPILAFTEATTEQQPLPYYQVAPDTYFVYGNIAEVDENNRGFNGNAGFVVTETGVVVIDALGSPRLGKRLINTIKMVTDQPIKYLILTHNHPDHAYGASAFSDIKGLVVIGHKGTLDYIKSGKVESSVAFRKAFIGTDMQAFEAVTPDVLIEGNLYSSHSIQLAGKTFEIYNTGAHHSFGDLVIYQKEAKIVWIADLAFNNRVTFMADGNAKSAIDAQNWLLKTFADAKLMIPGHGSAQTPPFTMVTRTRDYMQRLRTDMTKAVKQEVDLIDATQNTVYEDWKTVRMYELNHRKNVEFVYREVEEEAF